MTIGADSVTANASEADGGDRPEAHVYLVRIANASHPLVPSERHDLRGVDVVLLGRGQYGAERRREREMILRITDPDDRVSSAHARVRRVRGGWLLEDLDSRNGTWVAGTRVRSAALRDGDLIEIGRTFYLFRDGVPATRDDSLDLSPDGEALPGLTTLHPPLARELRAVAKVARSMVPVVVLGETGTGKELAARAIHATSGRSGPFVPVNCGGIPDTLVASELFGVRRGAYSDAREDRPGLIRSANKGTLFLDEIGDLKLELQPAFLRALQEHEVVPVGETRAVATDVRVISATHRELDKLSGAGRFREDLLARLAGFTIRLPPLRARREDLGLLIAQIIGRYARAPDVVSFLPDALRALLLASWPRNVRELEKRLEAALALADDGPIGRGHLGELSVPAPPAAPTLSAGEDARSKELGRLLEEHGGNLAAVARALGKDRAQVRRWLARYGLNAASFRR